jgi:predicted Rossmann fold flavoprotein
MVIGAGAAGLMAALFAARAGRPVTLVERTRDGGRKILISGGGRCNILPAEAAPDRYVTDSSPNTLRKILRGWSLPDQRAFFERELAMPLVLEAESGKLFPSTQRARDVRDRLLARVREAGVIVRQGVRVTGLRPPGAPGAPWTAVIEGDAPVEASAVVLATGGCSVPSTGSDGAGLAIARLLGHTIHATYPALTPLTAEPAVHGHLAGISLEVTIRAPGTRPKFATTGGFLFTHRGYSGPAVLDASYLAVRSQADGASRQVLTVQWTPRDRGAWETSLVAGRGNVLTTLAGAMPARLAGQLMMEAGIPAECQVAQLARSARRRLIGLLTEYPLPWTGDEGYRKAEVTGGGVALEEIDPGTMESRVQPGLFLCGELLDAFGPIGGHNFLWAWVTGRTAGVGAAMAANPAA